MSTTQVALSSPPPAPPARLRLAEIPKDAGVLLLVVALLDGIATPPPDPFDLVLALSGAAVLWPRAFRPLERWGRMRFPGAYRICVKILDRYLADVERRYPRAAPTWAG